MIGRRRDHAPFSGRACPPLTWRNQRAPYGSGEQARPLNGIWPAVLIVAALGTGAAAQDTVYIAGSTGGQTKITGRVLDYTGRGLRLERAGGREQVFPAEKVLRVETSYGSQQTQADALFAENRFHQALTLYLQAADAEQRGWVRRQIIAQIVWCYRALDQPRRAGEMFLLLIPNDPNTPHFGCIPLAWIARQAPSELEPAARDWLKRPEPAARLLGASHLLAGRDRPAALSELGRLAAGADRRVAYLALAQTWRTELVTASAEQVDGWSRAVERMPEPIAAGPYFVLGRARAQQQQPEQAALVLLRVAILYPQHRWLAAQSLLEAGRSLAQLDRTSGALRLYREVIGTYPEQTRAVAEAQSRLEELSNRRQPGGAASQRKADPTERTLN